MLKKLLKEFNKEFLGHLPLHQDLRNSADKGDPLTHSILITKFLYCLKIAEKIKQSFQ